MAILDGPELDSSDKKKPKVMFNELVERIEVIADDGAVKSNEPEHDLVLRL